MNYDNLIYLLAQAQAMKPYQQSQPAWDLSAMPQMLQQGMQGAYTQPPQAPQAGIPQPQKQKGMDQGMRAGLIQGIGDATGNGLMSQIGAATGGSATGAGIGSLFSKLLGL